MLILSIKKTCEIIKKNKSCILLLLFLQILLFISLSITSYKTIVPAMEHARSALDYYNSINITEDSAEDLGAFGYMGKDPLAIYNNYNKMRYYLKYLALFSVLSFLVIGSLVWSLSKSMVEKEKKEKPGQFMGNICGFFIISIISMLIVYAIIFQRIKASLAALEAGILPLISSLIILLLIAHFTFIALSLIGKKSLKGVLKATFKVGIFKAHHILLIYLINIAIISLFSFMVYWTIESSIMLLVVAVVLWAFSFVFARLFLIVSINEVVKELKN